MSPAGSKDAPEAKGRQKIDAQLAEAGWLLQDRDEMNLSAGAAIAVREFKLEKGHGYVDYLLFLDGKAVGVCEAKPAGFSILSVELQAKKYVDGLPATLDAPHRPLPFAYIATGEETAFINRLAPRAPHASSPRTTKRGPALLLNKGDLPNLRITLLSFNHDQLNH